MSKRWVASDVSLSCLYSCAKARERVDRLEISTSSIAWSIIKDSVRRITWATVAGLWQESTLDKRRMSLVCLGVVGGTMERKCSIKPTSAVKRTINVTTVSPVGSLAVRRSWWSMIGRNCLAERFCARIVPVPAIGERVIVIALLPIAISPIERLTIGISSMQIIAVTRRRLATNPTATAWGLSLFQFRIKSLPWVWRGLSMDSPVLR